MQWFELLKHVAMWKPPQGVGFELTCKPAARSVTVCLSRPTGPGTAPVVRVATFVDTFPVDRAAFILDELARHILNGVVDAVTCSPLQRGLDAAGEVFEQGVNRAARVRGECPVATEEL
jgi:hypothetical protein